MLSQLRANEQFEIPLPARVDRIVATFVFPLQMVWCQAEPAEVLDRDPAALIFRRASIDGQYLRKTRVCKLLRALELGPLWGCWTTRKSA